jgi:hypothetical protein
VCSLWDICELPLIPERHLFHLPMLTGDGSSVIVASIGRLVTVLNTGDETATDLSCE